jgi:hypothetical protein
MTDEERTALLARTAPVAGNGQFELFEGIWHNPEVHGPSAKS